MMCFMMPLGTNHTMSPPCVLSIYKVVTVLRETLELLAPKFVGNGKEKFSKQIIEAIDEEKKIITFKEFEGDIVNEYENWKVSLHVDEEGEKDLVSWTMEYERPNENVPELTNLLQFLIDMIKSIDDHHVNKPN
ncbi:hypothetical protein KY289_030066 [Solanum tuberosum]|nr:hypothetical protein KY289_030066 [Solanum tuberosum]